ncbi:hypothetical protein D3Z62_23840 [Lachnospiraceae bacterium]|nr:hypothetical protein [Lachnospiraceae bacterium]
MFFTSFLSVSLSCILRMTAGHVPAGCALQRRQFRCYKKISDIGKYCYRYYTMEIYTYCILIQRSFFLYVFDEWMSRLEAL